MAAPRNRIAIIGGGLLAGLLILVLTPFLVGDAGAQPRDFRNSLGMTFVWIPPGDFMMGAAGQETGRGGDEPRHQVTVTRPFYMQNREVTQGQWERVMGSNPSRFQSCGSECPVEQVSWHDVQEFIRRLNAGEGKEVYRLPTEAEWEYAARGADRNDPGGGFLYLTGSDDRSPFLEGAAWYKGNSCVAAADARWLNDADRYFDGAQYAPECGPQPGGRKRPNSWGLYDMLGNVWEWVQDWHGPYPTGPVVDPAGPPGGDIRVYRGGSWMSSPGYCLPSVRGGAEPGMRDLAVGFRLVRSVPLP
ncbi:MAG TPA: formylglycine-generating enzyme family protein [Syntrophales bacterium]|nr:formylglycine-generating enzyme family protein [Syntrophales bacterium]HOU77825.1 formylglycine-generating enzyme family protein [Syntrophales bacterium]HPC32604.1 formylglycine-generating enzyme family protein [Syntrophales bacterium]HQG34199.1 formylglycine-generating enzyme family protein [Syntrophales bacterium]HQI35544.1 formylglycine-generating enzyme family protein [Syntrophales bacterium]